MGTNRDSAIKILLIEDDAEYASLVQALLRLMWDTPSMMEHAGSLSRGLELLERNDFDIVLLDLTLPDCHGFSTFTSVRAVASEVPIIILSGTSDRALALKAVREGAQDYLVKGQIEGDLLIRSIRYAIERQRAERALRESEERYRCLFNNSHMIMLLIDSQTQEIVDANPAATSFYGYEREALIGKSISDIALPSAEPMTTGEMRPRPGFHSRHLLASGEVREVEVYSSPIRVRDRELLYLIVYDVTDLKRIEEELALRNEALVALNTIATMVSRPLDWNGVLETVLDKVLKITGMEAGWISLPAEESNASDVSPIICYRHPISVSDETVRQCAAHLIHITSESKEPVVLCHNNGVICVGVPVQSGNKVLGMLGLYGYRKDNVSPDEIQLLTAIGHQVGVAVENRHLAREAAEIRLLQEIDRMRSELIANISHELRTPLGLIKVFCTTLLRDDIVLDRATQREFLQDIDDETDKLERIVDNLLDLSRMESGRLQLDRQLTDLSRLVREVVEDMKLEVEPTLHQLTSDLPSYPLVAWVDPRRIEQVLRNLLSNAIKYSPQGGKIIVGGRGEGAQVVIWVRDHGIGIPPGELEKVFERFYRVRNEVTCKVRGAGLGLAVCRGIVEAHGGHIWVESVLHEGSTFYFTLPARNAEASGGLEGKENASGEI